jgi:excisionase family DNA binding protein
MYKIEQVADFLGVHVKTVRNYVREGRLKAVRIGKSYRISAADFAALTGLPLKPLEPKPVERTRRAEVSSIVEVSAVSPELLDRVTNMLMGAAQGHGQIEDQPLRVQVIYDRPRAVLKVILIGSLETAASYLRVIKALVEDS